MDWTDHQGTYKYTIQSLIHHILWEDGHYHEILDAEEYAVVKELIIQDSDNIYESNSRSTQIMLNKIYKSVIYNTGDVLHQKYKKSFSKDDYEHYLRMAGY